MFSMQPIGRTYDVEEELAGIDCIQQLIDVVLKIRVFGSFEYETLKTLKTLNLFHPSKL